MTITISGIIFGLLLLLAPLYILFANGSKLVNKMLWAFGKMLIFIGLLAGVLFAVIKWNNVLVSILAVLIMAALAAFASVGKSRLKVSRFIVPACAGITATTVVYSLYFLFLVMGLKNPFEARFFMPVCGLLIGMMLEVNYKALSTFYIGLEHHHQLYDYLLGNGAKHNEAVSYFAKKALEKAAIAGISNMAYIVIGATPFVLWALVMAGTDVITAALMQVLLLVAGFSATVVSIVVTLLIARRYAFDDYGALKIKE